ncbi:hypothetical protein Niako_0149 [Niastella koreensis GR20-10]|uniref:Uncharacterized protein n=2 Tax=Niastella koreensis TaxID=354356 RepID=G8TLI0_NIAKG|nr:hypothetical protein Niako_0149 [Niastella koreensis GR20-10]
MVYAKYKRGEFTPFKRDQFVQMTGLPVPAARFISLKGMGSCAVYPFYKLKVDIEKNNANIIKYHMVNDTLVISGSSKNIDDKQEPEGMNNSLVNIYLPPSVQLTGANCTFRIFGTEDSTSAASYNISLRHSYLFINYGGPDDHAAHFNQLNINSESSRIDLHRKAVINNLNLQLTDSHLNDLSATIGKLTMGPDDKSSIELSGKNANALK